MRMPLRVLAVDDNLDALFVLEEVLRGEGYEVITATEGNTALKKILEDAPDIVLLDINMPGKDGISVLKIAREDTNAKYIPIILLTARGETEEIVKGFEAGANDYIIKPYEKAELLARLQSATRTKELYTELKNSHASEKRLRGELGERFSFANIIGKSEALSDLIDILNKVVDSPVPILLLGETGTGKELFAKGIHFESPRRDRNFVTQNCATLSETLLESELFGHIKGSFTGAIKDKEGLFSVADKGTLFLDEIGEMPLSLQAKLLRVLQDGSFTPVGDTKSRSVDVRIVAATHRDLPSMVKNGTFREDLFYRLNVVQLKIPPLRQRKSDIPLLVDFILAQAEKKLGRGKKRLSPATLQALSEHDWPGNVRQLQNEIERLVLLSGSEKEISPQFLSPEIHESTYENTGGEPGSHLKDSLMMLEKQLITDTLQKTKGNKSEAARILGISRSNLIAKAQSYGLE